MSFTNFLWVGLGGALGSMLRYACYLLSSARASMFPWATLTVNVMGCLAIGVLSQKFAAGAATDKTFSLLLIVGFLGGFTTFSTFGLDNFQLLTQGNVNAALLNVLGNVVLGIGAVYLGRYVGSF